MAWEREIEVCRDVARRAREILALRHAAKGVVGEDKADDSPVTVADRECERLIVSELRAAFPGDGFLGEEGASDEGTSGRRWIVDPIDGTRDFLRGLPTWSNLIGLEVDGEVVLGTCNLAAQGELYWAVRGQGACGTSGGCASRRSTDATARSPASPPSTTSPAPPPAHRPRLPRRLLGGAQHGRLPGRDPRRLGPRRGVDRARGEGLGPRPPPGAGRGGGGPLLQLRRRAVHPRRQRRHLRAVPRAGAAGARAARLPELPDLLYILSHLRERLLGRLVTAGRVREPVVLRFTVRGNLSLLLGRTLADAFREPSCGPPQAQPPLSLSRLAAGPRAPARDREALPQPRRAAVGRTRRIPRHASATYSAS